MLKNYIALIGKTEDHENYIAVFKNRFEILSVNYLDNVLYPHVIDMPLNKVYLALVECDSFKKTGEKIKITLIAEYIISNIDLIPYRQSLLFPDRITTYIVLKNICNVIIRNLFLTKLKSLNINY
jgi:hypothetical protein